MSSFVSRVEKKSKRGGFFSAKNIHSVVEDTRSSDWFKIKFDVDASEFQYTPAEQSEITKDVKSQLIERAMKNLASVNTLNSTPPPMPSQPKTTGAGYAAVKIKKSCWWLLQISVAISVTYNRQVQYFL